MPSDSNKIKFNQPKQERSHYLVDIILDSALIELVKNGVEKITTTKISKRAGISVGSFYQYFPNKETLLLEVAKKVTHGNRKKFKILVESIHEETIEKEVQIIVNYMVDKFIKNSKHIKYLYKFVVYYNQFDFIFFSRNEVAQVIANYLVRKNLFSESAAKPVAYVMTQSFVGTLHNYALDPNPTLNLDELKIELSQLFVARIKKT